MINNMVHQEIESCTDLVFSLLLNDFEFHFTISCHCDTGGFGVLIL